MKVINYLDCVTVKLYPWLCSGGSGSWYISRDERRRRDKSAGGWGGCEQRQVSIAGCERYVLSSMRQAVHGSQVSIDECLRV